MSSCKMEHGDPTLSSWKDSIRQQRAALFQILEGPMQALAQACEPEYPHRDRLTGLLLDQFDSIPFCTYLYVLDRAGAQLSDNASRQGGLAEHFGRDRSARPYMRDMQNALPDAAFILSDAYISLIAHRPSLTALHTLHKDGAVVGFVGADIDLRDLPMTGKLYSETGRWQQIKGDPAIRGTVFQQTRIDSKLDRNIDQAMRILEELLVARGMFQGVIHFSSSRATIWVVDDPFRYRILQHDALSDPDVCLAYPQRPYPGDAAIPADKIADILQTLAKLRFSDDTLYLRSASLNIFNGLISLTFSCDGSHYMPYQEFLEKDATFWQA